MGIVYTSTCSFFGVLSLKLNVPRPVWVIWEGKKEIGGRTKQSTQGKLNGHLYDCYVMNRLVGDAKFFATSDMLSSCTYSCTCKQGVILYPTVDFSPVCWFLPVDLFLGNPFLLHHDCENRDLGQRCFIFSYLFPQWLYPKKATAWRSDLCVFNCLR